MHPLSCAMPIVREKKKKKKNLSAINHGESLTKLDESLTVHLYIIDTQYLHKEKTHCVCMCVLLCMCCRSTRLNSLIKYN